MIRRWYFRPLLVLVVLILFAAAFVFIIRPWYFNWGATGAEIAQPMPGDELVPQPAKVYTRAITIRAPADDVWPWLVQFGQGEGGMYSYEWFERSIGCDMHNADQIVPEWQTVSAGSEVRMCQPGYGPPPYLVAAVDPGRALILGHHVDGGSQAWAETWVFVASPVDAQTTRLFIRSRTTLADGFWAVIEPGVFIMEYGMLHGIKARAEAMAGVLPEPPWGWIGLGIVAALVVLYFAAIRPWHQRWGATREEVTGAWPGDDLVSAPKVRTTHAITIHASPADVWPWLVQMGYGRAGLYAYDDSDGSYPSLGLRNTDRIIPEFQDLKAGDAVPLTKGISLRVAILEPGRALVLHGDTRSSGSSKTARASDSLATSWGFCLDDPMDGSTRLVERLTLDYPRGILAYLAYRVILEGMAFVMERRMLRGIKAGAEKLMREKSGGQLARA